MSETQIREGGCGCGQLRYKLTREPIAVHCCHCTYCQRESGSAFGTNLVMEADEVELKGESEAVPIPAESGTDQQIIRCPTCKVAVSGHYAGSGPGVHFVREGTLDDKSGLTPTAHIFTSTKQEWVETGDVPAFEGFYPPREVLTDEQRARWKGAMRR